MLFKNPEALVLLIFIPLLYPSLLASIKRPLANTKGDELSLEFVSAGSIDMSSSTKHLKQRNFVLFLIRSIALICTVIAIARPQHPSPLTQSPIAARDVLIAVDTSGSMEAIDFSVDDDRATRLEALKHVVKQFIDKRNSDRIGLIVFGEEVFTQCPLTLDHEVLKKFVDSLEVGNAGMATAVGMAISVSLKRLKDFESKSKVIILVSDGKSNAGSITPITAASIAKKLGVKIHVVGIGKTGKAPFATSTMLGLPFYGTRHLEYDAETLQKVAEITGGTYFNAQNTEELENVYKQIDLLETRTEDEYQHAIFTEHFANWLWAALFAVAIAEFLRLSFFRIVPD